MILFQLINVMIKNLPFVSILMCSYNGAANISSQIDSILLQNYPNWNLYIHDDGSSDETISIIERYVSQYSNIFLVLDGVKGRGAKDSFIWLMEQIDSDYYMFCDQDDFWLNNKIELTIEYLLKNEAIYGKNIPIVVHSDLFVVDENLNMINESFWRYSKLSPKLLSNYANLQILNCVTGCAMGFNRAAKECSLPINNLAPMHDWWVALSTLKNNGIIDDINTCTIKYRQHSNNVVGARNISFNYFVYKIRTLIDVINENEKHLNFLKSFSGMSHLSYYLKKVLLSIKRLYYVTK